MDEILVKKALSGDKVAFCQLVEKYQSQVYGIALNICHHFSDAEDLAQEAFLHAYLSLHQLREPAKFGNWLYRITENLCRRWLQKKRRREEITESFRIKRMDKQVATPEELVEKRELKEQVLNAILKLPEQERLIITLYYMDGLTQRDIAHFVGISEITVRRHLRSLRQKLKGDLLVMVQENLPKHDLTSDFTEKVAFKIETLEAAIKDAIGKHEGAILTSDLQRLTNLDAPSRNIDNLSGLENCTSLQRLWLTGNQVSDLKPLNSLTKVQELSLATNQISDITPLSRLTNMRHLWLGCNQVSDLSPLGRLTNLEGLWLMDNQISDLSPLSKLTNLQVLHLGDNQISDLTPLSRLMNLRVLLLGDNQVSDLTPLSKLTKLQKLWLANSIWGDNQVSDITPLSNLTNLRSLGLFRNQISDLTPLSNLTKLQVLSMYRNQIEDLNPLSGLQELRVVILHRNRITDIKPLANMKFMQILYLDFNQIEDLSPLAGMPYIGTLGQDTMWGEVSLSLSNNQISDISPLVNNPGIEAGNAVDLTMNPLNAEAYCVHIPALKERRVKVRFD